MVQRGGQGQVLEIFMMIEIFGHPKEGHGFRLTLREKNWYLGKQAHEFCLLYPNKR